MTTATDHQWCCYICRRTEPIAWGTYVRVTLDGAVVDCCDDCVSRADLGEPPMVTLDYSEGNDG